MDLCLVFEFPGIMPLRAFEYRTSKSPTIVGILNIGVQYLGAEESGICVSSIQIQIAKITFDTDLKTLTLIFA